MFERIKSSLKKPSTWIILFLVSMVIELKIDTQKNINWIENKGFELFQNKFQTLENQHDIKIIKGELYEKGIMNNNYQEQVEKYGTRKTEFDNLP